MSWFSNIFCSGCFGRLGATGPLCEECTPAVERWALHNAKKATPDGIIAEYIVASFARDYDDWKVYQKPDLCDKYAKRAEEWTAKYSLGDYMANRAIVNDNKKIKLTYRSVHRTKVLFVVAANNAEYKVHDNFCVNGIPISDSVGEYIWKSFDKLKQQMAKAKATAEKAEREMKENEAKWNLAENLLGMKRNEFGALVPVNPVEIVK